MKPWGNLGAVETIYEDEEEEEDYNEKCSSSPSLLSSPPTTSLHSRVEDWYIFIIIILKSFFPYMYFTPRFLNFYLILFLGIVYFKVIDEGV